MPDKESVVDYETQKRLGFLCPSIHKLSNRNEAVRAAQRATKSTDHGRRRWNFQVSIQTTISSRLDCYC